jgi:hypothetical protein
MIRILSFAAIAMLNFAACSAPPESSAVGDTSLDGTFVRAPLIIDADAG